MTAWGSSHSSSAMEIPPGERERRGDDGKDTGTNISSKKVKGKGIGMVAREGTTACMV